MSVATSQARADASAGTPATALPTLLRERAERTPDAVFLMHVDGGSCTFGELEQMTRAWMAELAAAQVGPGERVAVMLRPCFDAIALWMAIARLGAIEVPINTGYVGTILAHVLAEVAPRVLVGEEESLARLAALDGRPDGLEHVLTVSDRAALGQGADIVSVAPAAHDVATIVFTSGTTGRSKGVAIPWAQAEATARWCIPLDALGPDDVWYSPWPLFHVSGKLAVYATALAGARLVLRETFSTSRFWPDVRATGATTTMLVAATVSYLDSQPPSPTDRQHTLRNVFVSPMPSDPEAFADRFGVRLCTAFNMTEVSCPIVTGWELGPRGSCGRARPGATCRIVDEHDREVPDGEAGELVVRTDAPWEMTVGYWGRLDATVAAWRNQWFHTGDVVRRDADGHFYFVDRLKDAIRRRGENVSSMELEAEVNAHPDVVECAAIGVPSEWGEEEIKVFVVARDGARVEPAQLVEFLRPRIPRFMLPRYVVVVEDIPKTPNHRARKDELRALPDDGSVWDGERRD